MTTEPRSNVDLVKDFLRAQNLEQVGDPDGAISLYEVIVDARFDSTGPYDRLIALYSHRAMHREVARVAEAALANVRTHEGKRGWYQTMRSEALKAASDVPRANPRPSG